MPRKVESGKAYGFDVFILTDNNAVFIWSWKDYLNHSTNSKTESANKELKDFFAIHRYANKNPLLISRSEMKLKILLIDAYICT